MLAKKAPDRGVPAETRGCGEALKAKERGRSRCRQKDDPRRGETHRKTLQETRERKDREDRVAKHQSQGQPGSRGGGVKPTPRREKPTPQPRPHGSITKEIDRHRSGVSGASTLPPRKRFSRSRSRTPLWRRPRGSRDASFEKPRPPLEKPRPRSERPQTPPWQKKKSTMPQPQALLARGSWDPQQGAWGPHWRPLAQTRGGGGYQLPPPHWRPLAPNPRWRGRSAAPRQRERARYIPAR